MTSKSMDLKNTAEKLGKDWVLGGSWLITVAIVSPITKTWCCGTPSKGLTDWMILQVFPGFQGETDPAKMDFSSGAVVPETGESMLRLDLDIPCPSINNLATYYAVLHLKARWWSRFTFERVTFSSSQKSDKESPGRWCFLHFLLFPFRKFRKWSEMIQFDQYVSIGLKPPTGKVLLVRLTFFLVGK